MKLKLSFVILALSMSPTIAVGQDKKTEKETVKKTILRGTIKYWTPTLGIGAVKTANERLNAVTVKIHSLFKFPESGLITMTDKGFSERKIVIGEGCPVTFHNKRKTYCKLRALSKRGGIDLDEAMPPRSRMTKTFPKEAHVKVQCSVHKDEWCWIIVSKNKSYSGRSNDKGFFGIKGAKPGPYRIEFSHEKVDFDDEVFIVKSRSFTVRTDTVIRLNLAVGVTELALEPIGLMKPKPGQISGCLRGVKAGYVYVKKVPGDHRFKKSELTKTVNFEKDGPNARVVVVGVGGKIILKNQRKQMMNVKSSNPAVRINFDEVLSQKGDQFEFIAKRRGSFHVEYRGYSFAKPLNGRIRVLVADNPYYAIINEAGCFTLPKLPSGKYRLVFWTENDSHFKVKVNGVEKMVSARGLKIRYDSKKSVFISFPKKP